MYQKNGPCTKNERFSGLPARRCGDCGGCAFYVSANVSTPTCVDCKPPTSEAAVSRLWAVLSGSRLRYRLDPPEAVTGETVRRANVSSGSGNGLANGQLVGWHVGESGEEVRGLAAWHADILGIEEMEVSA